MNDRVIVLDAKYYMRIKDDILKDDLSELTYNMKESLIMCSSWCNIHDLEFVVTSVKSDRKKLSSISRTHEEGRAVDIRSKDWSRENINKFLFWANLTFKGVAAVSAHDLVPRYAIYHDNHIHLQVKR